jgi:CheY-like chemotaxis protein
MNAVTDRQRTMKVLIVDDNAEMRRLLRGLVARLAEAVYECEDGADWVLMDIEMPRVDGLEATRQLKSLWPDARVCIVTGYDLPEWREAAQAAGATGYVLKEELHTVRRVLRAQEEL